MYAIGLEYPDIVDCNVSMIKSRVFTTVFRSEYPDLSLKGRSGYFFVVLPSEIILTWLAE